MELPYYVSKINCPSKTALFAVKNESASNADGYGLPIKFEVPVPQ
jgi:hypothetical protein